MQRELRQALPRTVKQKLQRAHQRHQKSHQCELQRHRSHRIPVMHSSDRKRKQPLADPPKHQRQTGALVQWLQMRVTRAPERASRMLLKLQLAVRQTLGRAAETRRMKGMKTG